MAIFSWLIMASAIRAAALSISFKQEGLGSNALRVGDKKKGKFSAETPLNAIMRPTTSKREAF